MSNLYKGILYSIFILIIFNIINIIVFPGNNFIHPHVFENIGPMLLDKNGNVYEELINIFKEPAPGEFRPRFITYAIALFDLRFKYFLYSFLSFTPINFSFAWIFTLVIGPVFLYKAIKNITSDQFIGLCAVIIYMTSIGFLSGFGMYFMEGKPLSNVIFIMVFYYATQINNDLPNKALYFDSKGCAKWLTSLVLLIGLFIDEIPIFAFLIPIILFPERFFDKNALARSAVNMLLFILPALIFLVVVIILVPIITEHAFGYRFDYIGSLFAKGDAAAGAKSFYQGPYGIFGWKNIAINFSTLFGINLLPWQIVPLIKDPAVGGVISDQSNGVVKWLILAPLAYMVVRGMKKARGNNFIPLAIKSAYLCIAYIVFSSLLAGRHVPFITGYYYACAWPVLFTILISSLILVYKKTGLLGSKTILISVLAISIIQVNNFYAINESWVSLHNNRMVYPNYKNKYNLTTESASIEGLNLILSAWKEDRLDNFLHTSNISSGEVYLVCDLNWIKNQ